MIVHNTVTPTIMKSQVQLKFQLSIIYLTRILLDESLGLVWSVIEVFFKSDFHSEMHQNNDFYIV